MQNPEQILLKARTIAVVGASPNPARPSHWISEYLMAEGYKVIPVNPGHSQLFGLTCYPAVEDIPEDVDIVNILRRSDRVLPIVESSIRKSGIKLVWMQDNVYNEEAAELLNKAAIPVIMNDCIYRVHRRLK